MVDNFQELKPRSNITTRTLINWQRDGPGHSHRTPDGFRISSPAALRSGCGVQGLFPCSSSNCNFLPASSPRRTQNAAAPHQSLTTTSSSPDPRRIPDSAFQFTFPSLRLPVEHPQCLQEALRQPAIEVPRPHSHVPRTSQLVHPLLHTISCLVAFLGLPTIHPRQLLPASRPTMQSQG